MSNKNDDYDDEFATIEEDGTLTLRVEIGQGVIHFIDGETVTMHINTSLDDDSSLVPFMQSVLNIIVNRPDMVEESFKNLVEMNKGNQDAEPPLPFPTKEV